MLSMKMVMRLNAASCLLFGVLFVILPSATADFLAHSEPASSLVILSIGFALLFNGAHLVWAAIADKPKQYWVWYFSAGDFAWVLATTVLILTGTWVTSLQGIVVAIAVAIMVGTWGVLQLLKRD